MSSNVVNSVAYLRTSRDFPEEPQALRMELNKSYIDSANAINSRTIGLFPTNRPAINGEEWFITASKQQGQRQVYTFTGAGSIAHGITVSNISGFTRIYGTVKDSSGNWYPLPLVSSTDVTAQISLQVTSSSIVIAAGADTITIASGYVVLEWLAQA